MRNTHGPFLPEWKNKNLIFTLICLGFYFIYLISTVFSSCREGNCVEKGNAVGPPLSRRTRGALLSQSEM